MPFLSADIAPVSQDFVSLWTPRSYVFTKSIFSPITSQDLHSFLKEKALYNAQSFQLLDWDCKKASFIRDGNTLVIKKETLNTYKYIELDEYALQQENDWKNSERGVQRESVIFEQHDNRITIRHKRDCVALEIQHLVKGEIEDIVACTHKQTKAPRLLVLAKDKATGHYQLTVFQKK